MRKLHIIIVGAGLGGLAAAAGLQMLGHRVSVFEQSSALGEIGAGIMLTPNALRALEAVGAMGRVAQRVTEPAKAVLRHYLTAELLRERDVAGRYEREYGRPMYNIHRADLHDSLANTVLAHDPASVFLGHSFEGVEQDSAGVEVRFANGARSTGDVLIGSDGIRSAVRRLGVGVDSPARFTNFIAWRGLVPLENLPEHLRGTSMTSWGSPDRHIIEYAVGPLKNYVALAPHSDWRSESWSTPSTITEVLEAFPDWHEDITAIIKATPEGGSFKFALFDRDPLDRWRQGLTTLLGDAAHPMLPLMAQGSAMALEDAAILARAFAVSAGPIEALDRYEAARRDRTAWAQLESRAATDTYHSTEKEAAANNLAERSNTLYRYDVSTAAV